MAAETLETLHPGVYLAEKGGQPLIQAGGVSTGSLGGIFKKGPIDRPMLAFSWDDVVRMTGGFYKNSQAPINAYLFFKNRGSRLYMFRVTDGTAVKADVDLKCLDNTDDALTGTAFSEGAHGNQNALYTMKYETTTTATIATGIGTVTLTSMSKVELGDRVIISDGTTTIIATVLTIDLSTNTITFKGTAHATIATAATVKCSSTHRTSTIITSAVATGATSAVLEFADNVVVGTVLTFASALQEIDVLVTSINGNEVRFDAITIGATIATSSIAVSQEFDLTVYDQGRPAESTFTYLSMEPTNEQDYIELRLSADGNASNFITLEDLSPTPSSTLLGHKIPFPISNAALTSGDDGGTPGDSDYIGAETLGAETGLNLLNKINDVQFVCIPGVATVNVEKDLILWCEARFARARPVFPLLDVPITSNTALTARSWKSNSINRDTSHGGLFYPWYKFQSQTSKGTVLDVPPSGANMGVYSRTAATRGPWKAPANEEVLGIIGLEHLTTDGEQDILNPIGVNVTRVFENRGIRLYGARTLTSNTDGRHFVHKRLTLNMVERDLADALQKYVFEPQHEDTWDLMRMEAELYLNRLWLQGCLQPRDDRSQAFFVKVDETNNPQSERDAGRLHFEVGINIVGTAEMIIFTCGLWDGGRLVQEVAA